MAWKAGTVWFFVRGWNVVYQIIRAAVSWCAVSGRPLQRPVIYWNLGFRYIIRQNQVQYSFQGLVQLLLPKKCYHYDNQILYAGFESEIVLNSAACEIEEGKRADK